MRPKNNNIVVEHASNLSYKSGVQLEAMTQRRYLLCARKEAVSQSRAHSCAMLCCRPSRCTQYITHYRHTISRVGA